MYCDPTIWSVAGFAFHIQVGSCHLTRRRSWRVRPCMTPHITNNLHNDRDLTLCLLGKSVIEGLNPALVFKFQRTEMFLPCSLVKIQQCRGHLWPKSSELGLRKPRFEFQIQCLEGGLILFISLFFRRFYWPSSAYMCTNSIHIAICLRTTDRFEVNPYI